MVTEGEVYYYLSFFCVSFLLQRGCGIAGGMGGMMLFQVLVPLLLVATASSSGKNNTSASFLESIVAMFYISAL